MSDETSATETTEAVISCDPYVATGHDLRRKDALGCPYFAYLKNDRTGLNRGTIFHMRKGKCIIDIVMCCTRMKSYTRLMII